ELADLRKEKDKPTTAVVHTREIQKLKLELEQERNKLANIQLKYLGLYSALQGTKIEQVFLG
ncbi:hypothetical protein HN51_032550, partial [Arachis hypogaea]